MPVNPIIFKVTDVGRDAAAYAFNNLPSGKLSLTAIKVGLAKYSTVGNETALQNPLPNTFSIGGGGVQAGSGQIRFTPILASLTRIEAFEIGLFTDTGVLFAIAATPSNTPLLVIEPDIEAIFSMNVALTNVDPDSIEIVVDVNAPLAVVMMGQHLSAAHPHSQYKRTHDASERLKVADGVDNDEAVSKGQLNAEATARQNDDLALSIALAAEITNRQNADTNLQNTKANLGGSNTQRFKVSNAVDNDDAINLAQLNVQKNYLNTPILTLENGQTSSITLTPNSIIRILLVGAGGGGGQVNENYSGVNDYSSYPNQGVAANGTASSVSIVGIGQIAVASGGLGGKSGMRDIGVDAGRYTGYAGSHGHAVLNVGYAVLLGAARPVDISPKRVHQDHPYPYYAYTIASVPLGNYGLGGDGAYGTFLPSDLSGAGGAGGNGAVLECLIKNTTNSNMTLELTAGQLGQGYYYDIGGDDYAGSNGFGGLVVVYA